MTTHELLTNKVLLIPVVVPVDTPLFLNEAWKRDVHNLNLWMALILKSHYSVKEIMKMKPVFVGTIQHPGVFSFDPEPFVVKTAEPEICNYCGSVDNGSKYIENYQTGTKWFAWNNDFIYTPQDSFISLLQLWGYHWNNRLGEKPKESNYMVYMHDDFGEACDGYVDSIRYELDFKAWQEAESRKLSVDQMVVLIQVK